MAAANLARDPSERQGASKRRASTASHPQPCLRPWREPQYRRVRPLTTWYRVSAVLGVHDSEVETVIKNASLTRRTAPRHHVFTSQGRRTQHVQPNLHVCLVITNRLWRATANTQKSEGTLINVLASSASRIRVAESQMGNMPEAEVVEYPV